MRKLHRTIATAIIATGIAGGTYAFLGSPLVPTAQAAPKDHPIIQTAVAATKDAIADLKAAPTDFHGHRAAAIKALQAAVSEMQICLKSSNSEPSRQSLASYPRIEAAKTALQSADTYIKNAAHDFNGHRADAQKAIEAAISQINICLQNG